MAESVDSGSEVIHLPMPVEYQSAWLTGVVGRAQPLMNANQR
jgi:hypothetical protein